MTMQSPGVRAREFDRTDIIRSVGMTPAAIIITEPWKGEEFETHLLTDTDELVDSFGIPTDKSKIDILSAEGYLKYAGSLYATPVRPKDATFAGAQIKSGYSTDFLEYFAQNYTYNAEGTVDSDEEDGPYDYKALGVYNIDEFADVTDTEIMSSGNPLWFISKWRNESANNIRILVYDQGIYNAIKYFDTETEEVDTPFDMTIPQDAIDHVEQVIYPAYKADPSDNTLLYPHVRNNLENVLDTEYQLGVIIQWKDQVSNIWDTKETYVSSVNRSEMSDSGTSMFIESVINEQSKYVRVSLNSNNTTSPLVDNGPVKISTNSFVQLDGGKNGVWGRYDDLTGVEALDAEIMNVLDMLYKSDEDIDIGLIIESNKSENVKRKIVEICELRKDCLCILDIKKSLVVNNKGNEARDILRWRYGRAGSTFNPNSSYATLYDNWLEVFDRWNRKYEWVPASGYVAGIYANSDSLGELWFAPAGLNRAILTGVRRLAWNPDKGSRDLLYPAQINSIVSFTGQGKVIWGNRTLLDKGSSFQSINVRRLFIHLRKNILKASKYYIFEQIDDITFAQLRNTIEPFLKTVKGRRGIEEYKIVLDETLNTPETRARNEVWGNIFIVPVGVAEFITLDFIATKAGVSFTENVV